MRILALALLLACLGRHGVAAEVADIGGGLLVYPDSVQIREVIDVRKDGDRKFSTRCMTVADEYAMDNGIRLAKGKEICFDEDGHLIEFTPARGSVSSENGMTFAEGRTFSRYRRREGGRTFSVWLGKDWLDPVTGVSMRAGTEIRWHANGTYASFTLAGDFQIPKGGPLLRGGTRVALDEAGNLSEATIAAPWTDPRTGMPHAPGDTVNFTRKPDEATLRKGKPTPSGR